jgi:hypothetical protein
MAKQYTPPTLICSTCRAQYDETDPSWVCPDGSRIPVHMDWGWPGALSEPKVCGSGVEVSVDAEPDGG